MSDRVGRDMSTPSPIAHPVAYPLYQDLRMFTRPFGFMQAWEFNGWKPESMSWKTGCYIHAGRSGPSRDVPNPELINPKIVRKRRVDIAVPARPRESRHICRRLLKRFA